MSQAVEDFLASLESNLKPEQGKSTTTVEEKKELPTAPKETPQEKKEPPAVPHYSSVKGHDYSTALRVLKEPIKDLIHELKDYSHYLRCTENPFKDILSFVRSRSPTEVTEVEIGKSTI